MKAHSGQGSLLAKGGRGRGGGGSVLFTPTWPSSLHPPLGRWEAGGGGDAFANRILGAKLQLPEGKCIF